MRYAPNEYDGRVTAHGDLRSIEVFRDLEDRELDWLAHRARIVELAPGEALIREGEPSDIMYAVVEGEVRGRKEKGLPDGLLYVLRTGQLSGMLPNSRMTHYPITARAAVPSRLLTFPADLFAELFGAIPALEARLASVMADRVRDTTEQIQLRERLVGLGKLSAGLAHELNNPSAAIQRSVAELQSRVESLSRLCETLLTESAGPTSIDDLRDLKNSRKSIASRSDPLEQSRAEDAWTSWLEDRDVENAWVVAETFAGVGIGTADLAGVDALPPAVRATALSWLESHVASRQLVAEIADAAERISGIVAAAKSYSQMDRAPAKGRVDVAEGLESTLTVLGHKWRGRGLRIARDVEAELPPVSGNAGELNQVWTNLIDNAIDASPAGAELGIKAHRSGTDVRVRIVDQGAGIDPANLRRIFEPFFSTKEVGEGTGLGLDIARRIIDAHHGQIRVDSAPGRTVFEVRLPAQKADA